jgi:hypothetical protein
VAEIGTPPIPVEEVTEIATGPKVRDWKGEKPGNYKEIWTNHITAVAGDRITFKLFGPGQPAWDWDHYTNSDATDADRNGHDDSTDDTEDIFLEGTHFYDIPPYSKDNVNYWVNCHVNFGTAGIHSGKVSVRVNEAYPTLFMILREKARRQGVGCCEGAMVGFGRRRAAGGVHLARISADPSAARGVTQTVRDDFRHTEAHCPPGLIESLCDRGADRPRQAGQGGACGIA